MTTLVSIISEQTLPNLLLIKELKGQYDKCLFISTDLMEGVGDRSKSRSIWIERAAGIEEGSVDRVVVSEDDWDDNIVKLEQIGHNADDRFLVNLTGGTKVMTLAVYSFFAKPGNRIVYASIGKNSYKELYPTHSVKSNPINYCVSLSDYLWCYGLFFTTAADLKYAVGATNSFFNKAKNNQFNFEDIPEIKGAHTLDNEKDKGYFSGGWFEEYVFTLFKEHLKIRNDRIAMNVKLYHKPENADNDNEFDLMFIVRNQLYVVECKMSLGKSRNLKDNLENALYKLGAITRDFGLQVNSYLLTLSDVSDQRGMISNKFNRRRQILGIKAIIDRSFFIKNQSVLSFIKL